MRTPTASLDLAVIGNGQISALIDRRATIVWSCMPRPDSDPVFCRLLATTARPAHAAAFSIELRDFRRSSRSYERNTAIITTVLESDDGSKLKVTDFCPRFRQFGRIFHPIMLIRILEPLAGRPIVRVHCAPHAGYGARRLKPVRGSNHLRFAGQDIDLRLTTDAPLTTLTDDREFVVTEPVTLVFGSDDPPAEALRTLAYRFRESTRDYWTDWVRTLAIPFEWQEAVIRAAITLKLCTYEDSGAVLAALTTSIPEARGTQRNWDYRYCWLRDSYFVVQTLNRLGATRTMEAYMRFILNISATGARKHLQPLYGVTGVDSIEEFTVATLDGYRGMGPVRVGNAAYTQEQHDIYGAVVLAATQAFFDSRLLTPGDRALFEDLEQLGRHALRSFGSPDAGIWEFRERARPHTFSSLMSWAACDRLGRIAARLGLAGRARFWRGKAADIRRKVLRAAWSSRQQSFVSHHGGSVVDASLLLMHEVGFIEADDPRFLKTLKRIERELRRGPYLMRYSEADDFGEPENAFNICSFWYINALAACGRRDEARALFENMLAQRTSAGLLSEDLDPKTGEPWGNYPQTYSLVGIIECAIRLSTPWDEAL